MTDELILVVEDEEDIQELVEYNLIKAGYRVECAETGEEGLLAAREHEPDLVVLDLMLPGLGGLEVCRRLKSGPDTAEMPVIILTAKGEEEDIVAGFKAGADHYVTKPFSPRSSSPGWARSCADGSTTRPPAMACCGPSTSRSIPVATRSSSAMSRCN